MLGVGWRSGERREQGRRAGCKDGMLFMIEVKVGNGLSKILVVV
jgi:hypothetical protein